MTITHDPATVAADATIEADDNFVTLTFKMEDGSENTVRLTAEQADALRTSLRGVLILDANDEANLLDRSKRQWPTETQYGMFSRSGNQAVTRMVVAIARRLDSGQLRTIEDVRRFMAKRIDTIAQKHDEVHDTAVRDAIYVQLAAILTSRGLTDLQGLWS
jgi:hypothetical protein